VAATQAPTANSVGVMLFNNVTGDTAYAYLGVGLATEIATSLARIPRLEVRSPGAVRSAMRGIEPDPRTVGRRLNVRYVVEGDFQRGGDRIRISVRLVALPSGTQRWSEAYTRPAADLLTVQEEIASAVAAAIAGQLLPQERGVLASRLTGDPEAYDHYLRGNAQLAKRTPAGVARAIEEYAAAVQRDPTFVRPHARIALGYALSLIWGWEMPGVPSDSQLALGFRAADRALALDSSSSDGWMARGYLLAERHPRTLDGVLPALERATTLDPRNPEAWHQYGTWLTFAGRFDDAIVAFRRALVLEPARAVTWQLLGNFVYPARRQVPEALEMLDSAIASDPEFSTAYAYRTFARLQAGDLAGARLDAEVAARLSPAREMYYGYAPQAAVAATAGDTAQALRLLDRAAALFAERTPGFLAGQVVATAMLAAGQRDRAIAFLERATPRGAVFYRILLRSEFDPIRDDPRFQRLMADSRPPWVR
jgi:TolB-like protein